MTLTRTTIQWIGLPAGPLAALLVYATLPDGFVDPNGTLVAFSGAGKATAAGGVWMALWWMTEAIPIYATSLLPLALFPLVGAASMKDAAAPYAHELIFLFMGGFILALAMERWGLHKRIAFSALRLVGTHAASIVGGFMVITAFLSMWVSNTATTIIMLPIALSIIDLVRVQADAADEGASRNFALALLLGIAYSASIGGVGTLIGTPPNLFLASFADAQLGIRIGFVEWMAVGIPLVAVFLPLTWLLLTRVLHPVRGDIAGGAGLAETLYRGLGAPNAGERATLAVFVATATLWMVRPLVNRWAPLMHLSDSGIAIIAALSLFLIPVDPKRRVFVVNWETAVRLPWGLLILFGGGLSLAAAVKENGVAEFIGAQSVTLVGLPAWAVVGAAVTAIVFLTELTSNTATTAALLPLLAAVAPSLGLPTMQLIVPAAVAASCAFMLPVATPPNAVVFGGGHVTVPEMARAGLLLNVMAVVLITALAYTVVLWVLV